VPSLWKRLADGLKKTRAVLAENLQQVFQREGPLDEEFYAGLEAALLGADVGPETTAALLDRLRALVRERQIADPAAARGAMREALVEVLTRGHAAGPPTAPAPGEPRVVLVVGVNGGGKTTSIGKLAWRYRREGASVLVVASDTYRAAALEQLGIWAERAGAELIRSQSGADPAAVAFDGVKAACSRGIGVVLIDTAGRLQTNANLMEELRKVHRVSGKALPGAPHEVLLVLDATVGQNALSQASRFAEAVAVTGIVLAKLDGSAKGGVILAVADRLGIPVRYVGLGEKIEDLEDFEPEEFARALLTPVGEEPEA
jgi:fused signal recognition particle receptor